MKNWILFFALSIPFLACAQQDSMRYRPKIVVGSSLTYIWDDGNHFLQEYTWSLNAAISPIKNLYVGANMLQIWGTTRTVQRGRYQLGGVFAQYRLSKHEKVGFYPEVGYYRGNYCTCGEDDQFARRGLNYLSVGGGFGWKIIGGLELETAFLVYNILNRIPEGKFSYTQYVIGLNYKFALPRRKHTELAFVGR